MKTNYTTSLLNIGYFRHNHCMTLPWLCSGETLLSNVDNYASSPFQLQFVEYETYIDNVKPFHKSEQCLLKMLPNFRSIHVKNNEKQSDKQMTIKKYY